MSTSRNTPAYDHEEKTTELATITVNVAAASPDHTTQNQNGTTVAASPTGSPTGSPIPVTKPTFHTDEPGVEKPKSELKEVSLSPTTKVAGSSGPNYMDYLYELKHAWTDRPDITITYSDMTYAIPTEKTRREVPNMAASMYDWFAKTLNPSTYIDPLANKNTFYALRPSAGIIKPKTMTLVLSPPGHGSSVFLKALGGKYRNDKNFSGKLEYNGVAAVDAEKVGARLSKLTNYADQVDAHLPHLTVYETFNVAYQHSSGNVDLLPNATPRLKELDNQRVELMIELLGLKECRNTIIGNQMVRGISGGQVKRVTIGEALLSNARLLLLDEITNGLDSSAAFDIFKYLRQWSDVMNGSVVTTLLQPTPEVVSLFDEIILLRESEVVYHGPVSEVIPYFESLGLPTPPDQDFADYINDFLSYPRAVFYRNLYRKVKKEKAQRNSLAADSTEQSVAKEIRDEEQKVPLSRESLGRRFKASKQYADTQAQITMSRAQFNNGYFQNSIAKWSDYTKQIFSRTYPHSTWRHTGINFRRQITLSLRNKEDLIPRFGQSIFFSLVLGSLFYGLGYGDYYLKSGAFFFSLGFYQFSSAVELPFTHEQKFVVYKHTDAELYPAAAHVFAHAVISSVVSGICAILYSVIIYYLCGFADGGDRFIFFVFVIFCSQLFTVGSFRLLAYSTTLDASMLLTSPVLFFGILYGGFLIHRDQIDWMIFLYYLSPFSWGVRSMSQNEFFAAKYQVPSSTDPNTTVGDAYLEALGMQTDPIWKWMGIIFLVGGFVLFSLASIVLLKYVRQVLNMGTRRFEEDDEAEEHDAAEIRRQMSRQLSRQITAAHGGIAPSGSNAFNISTPNMKSPQANEGSNLGSFNQGHNSASVLPFQPANLSWKDLEYTVRVKDNDGKTIDRKLLGGVSGYARAGQMTALMGSSGAGKTTLLDVIAGRKTAGKLQGDIYINGFPKKTETFNRSCGYVEQTDIHIGTATVREALEFSAKLRLPSEVTAEQRRAFVNEVIQLLELTAFADHLIGDETTPHGLSPGQLKRVTIGVELVANPPILFLDEPTSGLDSRAALIVMRVVRRIAATGRSVLCTIHQPSADLFYMFDRVLVLQRGGKTAFFGDLGEFGSDLVSYFENAPTGDDKGQPKLPEKTNPASWMLDVIGAGTNNANKSRDYAQTYESSPLKTANSESLKELMTPAPNSSPVSYSGVYATNIVTQFSSVFYRLWLSYWRDVDYNNTRVIVMLVVGIIMGLLWLNVDDSTEDGTSSKLSAIYIGIGFVGATSVMSALPVMARMRAVFYRERASYFYKPLAFSTALAAIEIPYTALISMAFTIPFYFMAGLENSAGPFFQYFFALFLLTLCFTYWGQFLIATLPNLIAANVLSGLSSALIFLFAGLFIQPSNIPRGWKWLYYIDWYPKALNAIASTQFSCDDSCPNFTPGGGYTNRQSYVEDFLSISFSINQYWNNIGWLFLTIGILHVLTASSIRYINHLVR